VKGYSWRNVVGAYVEEYERAVHEHRPERKVAA